MRCSLRPIEAICVCGAVDDCLERLRMLHSLAPSVITQRNELSSILGETIDPILKQQYAFEVKYEKLIKRRSELKMLPNKMKFKKNQEKIERASRELQSITELLCRSLREVPSVEENLNMIQKERGELIRLFEVLRKDLKDKYSFVEIARWTTERTQKYNKMMMIMLRNKEMQGEIRDLEAKIKRNETELDSVIKDLNAKIVIQREKLQIEQSTKEDVRAHINDEKSAKIAAQNKLIELNQKKIKSCIEESTKKFQHEESIHNSALLFLDNKEKNLSKMIHEWNEKYNKNITSSRKELEENEERLKKIKLELTKIIPRKERYKRLLTLEQERSRERAVQIETRHEQVKVMNRIKIIFLLHCVLRGPITRPR